MEHNLTIVPALNKVDLKHARPEEVILEMEQVLGIKPDEVLHTSGKTGVGVGETAGGHRRAHSAADGRSRTHRCKRCSSIPTTTIIAAPSLMFG